MPDSLADGKSWPELLIASHHTLSGVPARQPSRYSISERLNAAADAGFGGIGLTYYDYAHQIQLGTTQDDLRRATAWAGISVLELEMLYDWNGSTSQRRAARDVEDRLYEMADVFGARTINVTVSEPVGADLDWRHVNDQFAQLCDRADRAGLRVALEFQPWNAIPDLMTAWQVVDSAGRDNGGVLIDSWHFFRGEPDFELLSAIPSSAIGSVQISDASAAMVGSLWDDSTRRRRLPGRGEFPLHDFLDALRTIEVACPLSVEIISDHHMRQDIAESSRAAFDATSRLLSRASMSGSATPSE